MATQWETDRRTYERRRHHDQVAASERRTEAFHDARRLVLRFAQELERNWALSAALILAACIVMSVI